MKWSVQYNHEQQYVANIYTTAFCIEIPDTLHDVRTLQWFGTAILLFHDLLRDKNVLSEHYKSEINCLKSCGNHVTKVWGSGSTVLHVYSYTPQEVNHWDYSEGERKHKTSCVVEIVIKYKILNRYKSILLHSPGLQTLNLLYMY